MEPSDIIDSQEDYDRFVREVLVPRYDALKAYPSGAITFEQLRESMDEWDREDGLLQERGSEELKRSASPFALCCHPERGRTFDSFERSSAELPLLP